MLKSILGQFAHKENVRWTVRDKDGNIKKLFQPFSLFALFIKFGILSPFMWQIPGITGYFTDSLKVANIFTNTGKAMAASRFNGAGGEAAATYIGLGTGATAAAATDTALGAEITTGGLQRANATASRVTTTLANDTAQLVQSFTATAPFAVTEAGLFNAASAGVMAARQVFAAINLVSGDSMQITWKIQTT